MGKEFHRIQKFYADLQKTKSLKHFIFCIKADISWLAIITNPGTDTGTHIHRSF